MTKKKKTKQSEYSRNMTHPILVLYSELSASIIFKEENL